MCWQFGVCLSAQYYNEPCVSNLVCTCLLFTVTRWSTCHFPRPDTRFSWLCLYIMYIKSCFCRLVSYFCAHSSYLYISWENIYLELWGIPNTYLLYCVLCNVYLFNGEKYGAPLFYISQRIYKLELDFDGVMGIEHLVCSPSSSCGKWWQKKAGENPAVIALGADTQIPTRAHEHRAHRADLLKWIIWFCSDFLAHFEQCAMCQAINSWDVARNRQFQICSAHSHNFSCKTYPSPIMKYIQTYWR